MTSATAETSPQPIPSVKPLGWPEKLSYGLGDFASCLYWNTLKFLSYFYTDVFGLAPGFAANMVFYSRFLDAFFDPVMGMLTDRTSTRWGKFRPYFVWMCLPLAVAGVLAFSTPHMGYAGKVAWAIITYNALMLIYTAINIPYTALMGVITTNPLDRTVLSSIKYIGAFSGGILAGTFILQAVAPNGWLGAKTEAAGWQLAFTVIGVIACLCFIGMFFMTRERVEPPAGQQTNMAQDFADLVTNVPWLILVATTVAFILFNGIPGSTYIYYFKYYVGTQAVHLPAWLPFGLNGDHTLTFRGFTSWYTGINQGASLAGAFALPFIVKWIGRKATFMSMMFIAILSTLSYYFLKPTDVVPIFVMCIVFSLSSGPVIALLMTNYADTADYGEFMKSRRATGLIFSASIFTQKAGWSLAGWVGLHLQAMSGFIPNQEQSSQSLHSLVLLMSLIPAVAGVLAMIVFALYPLNEGRVAEISAELKRRRGEAATA